MFPLEWGEGPAGTVGGEDIFQIPEVVNGSPHVYALWPHVASLLLRGPAGDRQSRSVRSEPEHGGRGQAAARRRRAEECPGGIPAEAGW